MIPCVFNKRHSINVTSLIKKDKNLSLQERFILVEICNYVDFSYKKYQKDFCFITQDKLSKKFSVSVRTIKRYIASLKQQQYILIKKNKTKNNYYLNDEKFIEYLQVNYNKVREIGDNNKCQNVPLQVPELSPYKCQKCPLSTTIETPIDSELETPKNTLTLKLNSKFTLGKSEDFREKKNIEDSEETSNNTIESKYQKEISDISSIINISEKAIQGLIDRNNRNIDTKKFLYYVENTRFYNIDNMYSFIGNTIRYFDRYFHKLEQEYNDLQEEIEKEKQQEIRKQQREKDKKIVFDYIASLDEQEQQRIREKALQSYSEKENHKKNYPDAYKFYSESHIIDYVKKNFKIQDVLNV